mgnify:CR=1 FL=1
MNATINERLVQLIEALGMNLNRFAKSIDKAYTSVESICKGRTKPSFDLLESIFTAYPQVSRDWLLMGEGQMFRDSSTTPAQVAVSADSYLQEFLVKLEDKFQKQLDKKDEQIAGLQRTVDTMAMLLGKPNGVSESRIVTTETSPFLEVHRATDLGRSICVEMA